MMTSTLLIKEATLQELQGLLAAKGLVRGSGPGDHWDLYNRAVGIMRNWYDTRTPRPRYEACVRAVAEYLGA